jgi:hypothetical protein
VGLSANKNVPQVSTAGGFWLELIWGCLEMGYDAGGDDWVRVV